MNKIIPLGLSIIDFNNRSKNLYYKISPDNDIAKRLSKRIYKDAVTALSGEQAGNEPLTLTCD